MKFNDVVKTRICPECGGLCVEDRTGQVLFICTDCGSKLKTIAVNTNLTADDMDRLGKKGVL